MAGSGLLSIATSLIARKTKEELIYWNVNMAIYELWCAGYTAGFLLRAALAVSPSVACYVLAW